MSKLKRLDFQPESLRSLVPSANTCSISAVDASGLILSAAMGTCLCACFDCKCLEDS